VRQRGHTPQALGLRVLQPGQTFSARMRIQIDPMEHHT
jgi:hypothetical protein